jgi:hypothetical protein
MELVTSAQGGAEISSQGGGDAAKTKLTYSNPSGIIEERPTPGALIVCIIQVTFKVRPMFDPQRTLPVTENVVLKWRLLMEDGRQ